VFCAFAAAIEKQPSGGADSFSPFVPDLQQAQHAAGNGSIR